MPGRWLTRRGCALAGWALCLAVELGTTSGAEEGEDWPRFLGPRADNTSSETGLRDRWPTNGPPLLWERVIGTGYGAPSVLGNFLVVHDRLAGEEIVEALDAASGKSIWRHAYPSHFVDPYGYNNGPRASPLLTSNRCFTFGAEGVLTCLELHSGKVVWRRETAKDWSVPEAFFGVGSSPILEGGKLIVMIGGQPNAGVVALDPATGRSLWESVGSNSWHGAITVGWRAEAPYEWTGFEKSASYATPVAATLHGQRQLLCLMRQGLVSVNPTNGAVNWRRWFQSSVSESVNAMCPVVDGDLVLFSAAYYRIGAVCLRVRPDGRSFEEAWRSPRHAQERDPDAGGFVAPVLETHWATPVLHNGCLYAFSGRNEPDATFRCVELKTGRLRWSRDESWRSHSTKQPPVYGRGSAILADGKLIVLGEGGKLGLFQPNPSRPEEICSFQVPQLRFPCWAGPILSRKRLFLRSEDRLVCLNLAR